MKANFKRLTLWLLLVSLISTMLPVMNVSAAVQTSELGSLSDGFTLNGETFTLSEQSRIFVIADQEPTGSLLETVQLLQRQFAADSRPTDAPMPLVWGPEDWVCPGDLVISLEKESNIGADGYELLVTDSAKVIASDVDGLLYGGNMLLKHFRNAGSNDLQGFVAANTPDTAQRAVSLDCGRKYYTKDWICNFIREISWMGYNTLELHFSDDSGFRIDIWDETYYTDTFSPANDFSWLCGSNYTSWTLSAYQNDPDKGKYLSTAELVEILNTAKEYHIEVIPAFDSPSHLDYTTWSYEQNYKSNPSYSFYSTYDSKTYYAKDVNGTINYTNSSGWTTPLKWPYYSTVNVVSDHAKAFVFELYLDIADFFKTYANSTDFSIGADEVNLNTSNLSSGYSFTWGFSDFVNYINELNQLLNGKGYTMRMYNDFMGSTTYQASSYEFADNIEVLYWDSPFEPNSGGAGTKTEPVSYYVNKGATLYNCIQTNTYYALRITGSGSDARSVYNRQWTFYHANEKDIYNEWYPADFSEHGDYSEDTEDVPVANLGGAYFLIWCDYSCVSTEAQIWNGCYDATSKNTGEFYSLRDRMWSNITKMWNWDINETVDYTTFASLRDAYGDFPGCGTTTNACSEKTVLPAATPISSGYAGGCQEYASYCQIRILNDAPVMTLPCGEAVEASSTQLEIANTQELYTAIGLYENSVEELWYKVRTKDGNIGYLKADATEFVELLQDDIAVTGAQLPSGHVQGQEFRIAGDIQSRYNQLTTVAVSVYSGLGRGGTLATGHSALVTDNHYRLADSEIDNNIAFGQLPLGEHTYEVTADYRSYYVQDGQVTEHSGTLCLIEKCFLVLQTAVDQESCDHSYESSVLYPAGCETEGVQVHLCTACGHVYEEIIEPSGHAYTLLFFQATCTDYERVRYTCSVCDYSYDAYSESVYSQWEDTKPEGIDESLIQTKDVYRYSDYETVISYEPELEGYTLLESTWEQQSTGSVAYVSSWPSGFNQSSSLYTQFNKSGSRVTASETETTKRVIDSDQGSGYLYYHWCYANSYYSLANKSGSYTTFHAYYSTVSPSNYTCDTSDMSYCTAHSTCSNSQWFFVTTVNTQAYTDYVKQYRYGRWQEWSEWSDTSVTAGDSRKVETKRMYRYVNGSFADHRWDNGVCLDCGTACEHSYEATVIAPTCTEAGYTAYICACGHSYIADEVAALGHSHECVVTAPTCTEAGYTAYICACGDRYVVDEVAALGHGYETVTVDATCTTDGSITETCGACGDTKVEILPATGHSYETVTVDATCTTDGSITETCATCGHTKVEVISATGHSYEAVVTAPTCTEAGYTTYTCPCGNSYVADEVAALGHSYETVTVDATCTADGSITETCVTCGDTKVEVIPATGHSYEAVVTAPTCTEAGYTTYTCHCGDSYIADEVAALGHSYETVTVDATCIADGSNTETCVTCGDTKVEVIPATGHSYEAVVTEPTCTEAGYTTYTCHCGDQFVADMVDALGHSFDVSAVDPDCVIPGYTAHSCSRCGYSYYDSIVPALGHHYQTMVIDPTCTKAGYTAYYCERCGDSYYNSIVPALGHDYVATVTEPTYTSSGYTTYTCTQCGDSYKDEITEPIGHNYEVTVVDATCTTVGYTLYTCTCGESYTENELPALGHSYENGICIICGEADPDYVAPVVIPTLTLKAPTLEFKDMITVNAMFTAENIDDVVEMGMITYTENVDEWSVETANHVIPGTTYDVNTGRYIACSQGIHAKYLGDTVYLACYAKLTNDSYVYTKLAPYSPVQYAASKLTGTDTALKQLVVAMLNYGAAAQTHFDHNVDNLANASLTAEQLALPESYRSDMVSTVASPSAEKQGAFYNNKGFVSRYPAISFEGAFCINYFFTPNYAPVDGITLYYWNAADYEAVEVLSIENASGSFKLDGEGTGEYRGDIVGIAAKSLSEAVYVAAVYSDGTTQWTSGVLGYSIGAYCSSQATKGGTIADLAMATAVYGYQAKQYFG